MANKTLTLFDWLNEISYNKRSWDSFTQEDHSTFIPYMIHRFISMNGNYVEGVDLIQKYNIPPKAVYNFYCDIIPKRKSFFRYIKADNKYDEEEINILAKYYQLSKREIKDVIHLIKGDLIEISNQLNGVDSSKKRKVRKKRK